MMALRVQDFDVLRTSRWIALPLNVRATLLFCHDPIPAHGRAPRTTTSKPGKAFWCSEEAIHFVMAVRTELATQGSVLDV